VLSLAFERAQLSQLHRRLIAANNATSILACIARELCLPGTHIYTNPHSRHGGGRGRVKSKRGKQTVPTRNKTIQALEARFTLLICS
jgi:hypothetical protein